jgi:hypothetical protein
MILVSQPALQVTQRPGSSRLEISVSTLTTASHASFRSPDLPSEVSRAAWATGTRTSIEVSERPSSRSEIVCVRPAGADTTAARSALASRLMPMPAADDEETWEVEASEALLRLRPEAICAALNISETANTPRIPLDKASVETCR